MAEREIKCDDDPDPALKPEIGRELCRMKIFRGGDYGKDMQSGDYGGYKKEILTENITEREKGILICRKCKGIMKEACISERGEQLCSCCCEKSITKGPHTAIREMVSSLKCSCPLIERGCKWLGTLESCENHLDTCGYVYETCKLNCEEVLRREELERHEKENCTQRIVKCDHCDENFISRELNGHLEKCPKMKVACILLGCSTKITRKNMQLHLEYDCGMVKEMCKLGCGEEVIRHKLGIHEKENCVERIIRCEHCFIEVIFRYQSIHQKECPKMKMWCDLCGTKMTREEMELHFKYYCGMVKEMCKLGCGVELTRDELRIHEKENCPQRFVKCDHCNNNFKSCQLNIHHDECPKMKVSCDLCGTKMTREEIELHLKHDCGMVQEMCKLGCGEELTRDELRIHEKENCPQRLVNCDHCDKKIKSCELNDHYDVCPKMEVSCDLVGCDTKITREKMELHLKHDCGMVKETCKLGCGMELTRVELVIHEKEKCRRRLVKCDHCDEKIKSYQLSGHYDVCPKMNVSCNLCDTKMTREEMELHLKHDCGMVKEMCKLGCGMELTRVELVIHEKENCVQRKVQCEHCDIEVAFCDNSKHLKECPLVTVTCYQCGIEKYRKDMTKHFKDDCPEKMLDCPFVKYKCLARMKRKDIDKHLEEKETKHLGLKLTAMEDLITKQSEIIDKLNDNIEKQNKETTTKFSQQIKFLYFITDTTKIVWKIEDVRYPINYSSISKQYKVAGYKIAFKFHYCGSLSIVFPGTTINNVRPFIAKCHIMLHTRDTINCEIIEVKQKDVTKGGERIITFISQEDINKYSEPQFPGSTKKDLTLEIFITMQ